ncbi:hypothetical protein YB2330_005542 [Saitoella coloradoensis]
MRTTTILADHITSHTLSDPDEITLASPFPSKHISSTTPYKVQTMSACARHVELAIGDFAGIAVEVLRLTQFPVPVQFEEWFENWLTQIGECLEDMKSFDKRGYECTYVDATVLFSALRFMYELGLNERPEGVPDRHFWSHYAGVCLFLGIAAMSDFPVTPKIWCNWLRFDRKDFDTLLHWALGVLDYHVSLSRKEFVDWRDVMLPALVEGCYWDEEECEEVYVPETLPAPLSVELQQAAIRVVLPLTPPVSPWFEKDVIVEGVAPSAICMEQMVFDAKNMEVFATIDINHDVDACRMVDQLVAGAASATESTLTEHVKHASLQKNDADYEVKITETCPSLQRAGQQVSGSKRAKDPSSSPRYECRAFEMINFVRRLLVSHVPDKRRKVDLPDHRHVLRKGRTTASGTHYGCVRSRGLQGPDQECIYSRQLTA